MQIRTAVTGAAAAPPAAAPPLSPGKQHSPGGRNSREVSLSRGTP